MALSTGSRVFLGVLLLGIAGVAGVLYWLDSTMFRSEVEAGVPVEYLVAEGQSVGSVGDDLAELGVVSSAVRFRLAANDASLDQRMMPGNYEFMTGMSNAEVIQILSTPPPPPETSWFTVPEGFSVELTLERLARDFDHYSVEDFRAVLDARVEAGENGEGLLHLPDWVSEPGEVDDGIEPFEGLLFPETYEVLADASPRAILQRMVDQLTRVIDAIPEDQLAARIDEGYSHYELMVIASLIEREAQVNAERPVIAGVIYNRLDEGMLLQIDATVLYARGEHAQQVLTADTEIDSPYNTYLVAGLPPTPISGFGVASLRAAVNPDDVTYRYYVVRAPECDGTHVFADTLDQHNVNAARFRDAGRCL